MRRLLFRHNIIDRLGSFVFIFVTKLKPGFIFNCNFSIGFVQHQFEHRVILELQYQYQYRSCRHFFFNFIHTNCLYFINTHYCNGLFFYFHFFLSYNHHHLHRDSRLSNRVRRIWFALTSEPARVYRGWHRRTSCRTAIYCRSSYCSWLDNMGECIPNCEVCG